jgi:integrase
MPPVYEYTITVKLGDGKTKKEKRYKFDYKKVVDGVTYHRRQQGFMSRDEALSMEFQDKQELNQPKEKKEVIQLDDLFKSFLSNQATKLKPTTIADYEFIFGKYFDLFKKRYIHTLTPKELNKWKIYYVKMDMSERHTNKIILLMKKLIDYAIKKEYEVNPKLLDELEPIKKNVVPQERIAWSMEEIDKFFASFDLDNERENTFYHYFKILLDSTMRPNEFRCLQKKDIIGQYLRVNKTCSNKLKGQGLLIQPPKTPKSIRQVMMPQDDIDYLNNRTAAYNDDDFIFGKENVFAETTLRRELDKHIELSGVRHISAYNFRHTSITLLIKNGVSLNIVSKRAGHSSTSITMDHYWHLFKGDDEKALSGIKWGKKEKNTQ